MAARKRAARSGSNGDSKPKKKSFPKTRSGRRIIPITEREKKAGKLDVIGNRFLDDFSWMDAEKKAPGKTKTKTKKKAKAKKKK
jgi:hypothetical protein